MSCCSGCSVASTNSLPMRPAIVTGVTIVDPIWIIRNDPKGIKRFFFDYECPAASGPRPTRVVTDRVGPKSSAFAADRKESGGGLWPPSFGRRSDEAQASAGGCWCYISRREWRRPRSSFAATFEPKRAKELSRALLIKCAVGILFCRRVALQARRLHALR